MLGDLRQVTVVCAPRLHFVNKTAQAAKHRIVTIIEILVDTLACMEQLLGMEKALPFFSQFLILAGPQRCGSYLASLIPQQVHAPCQLMFSFPQTVQLCHRSTILAMEFAETLPLCRQPAESVQQEKMILGLQQGLRLMLPIDVDQAGGHIGQQRGCPKAAVQEHPVSPGPGDDSFHQQFPAGAESGFFQQGADHLVSFQIEHAFHGRFIGTGTDGLGRCPAAQDQVDCVDDDGFAGAGFTGQDVQTGEERDMEVFDDSNILYDKISQHLIERSP